MKKEMLLFLITIILAQAVTSAEVLLVTQQTPLNESVLTSGTVPFQCIAPGADNMTLNTNIGGTFQKNYTVYETSLVYTIYNLPNGIYNWNCRAANQTSEGTSTNWTFTVNLTTSFSGTIPNQTFNAGATLSDAFDLDTFFTGATKYEATGNSTITVTIGTGNSVSFTAALPANETITFKSGSATSNPVNIMAKSAITQNLTCANIPNKTITQNQNTTINLTSYCTGASNITFSTTKGAHITVTIANRTATIIPETDWTGSTYAIFTATAGSETAQTNNFTITVTGPGAAPQISSFLPAQDTQIPPGGVQKFSITKTGNGTLTVKWYLDNQLQSVTADSYTYTDTGLESGNHTVKVIVSDGIQETTKSWVMAVKAESEDQINTTSILTEEEITLACGDGTCGTGENCGACPTDCGCASNQTCEQNACVAKTSNTKAVTITIIIMVLLVAGGTAAYFIITRKPKLEKQAGPSFDKTKVQPASDISDFYKRTTPKPPEKEEIKTTQKDSGAQYIETMRSKGEPDKKIRENLKSKGWTDTQIEDSFSKA